MSTILHLVSKYGNISRRNIAFTNNMYNKILEQTKQLISCCNALTIQQQLKQESPLLESHKKLSIIVETVQQVFGSNPAIAQEYNTKVSKGDFRPEYIAQIILHHFPENIQNDLGHCFIKEEIAKANLAKNRKQLEYLKTLPTQIQGTPPWFEQRLKGLTASNIIKVILGSDREKAKIVLDKCGRGEEFDSFNAKAIQNGVKYEDVGVQIFENRTNLKVHEFGCMDHPLFSFLKASPDGIDENGEMLEIKMPYSRIPLEVPKKEYYHQMQLQLEVCNLDVCNFLESVIKEYNNFSEYKTDVYIEDDGTVNPYYTSDGMEKGVILKGLSMHQKKRVYKYCPIHTPNNKIENWIIHYTHIMLEEQKDVPDLQISPIFWKQTQYSCIRIYRDTNWITKYLPLFHKFWRTVLFYRENPDKLDILEKALDDPGVMPSEYPGIISFNNIKPKMARRSGNFSTSTSTSTSKTTSRTSNSKLRNFNSKQCLLDSSDDEDKDAPVMKKVVKKEMKKVVKKELKKNIKNNPIKPSVIKNQKNPNIKYTKAITPPPKVDKKTVVTLKTFTHGECLLDSSDSDSDSDNTNNNDNNIEDFKFM